MATPALRLIAFPCFQSARQSCGQSNSSNYPTLLSPAVAAALDAVATADAGYLLMLFPDAVPDAVSACSNYSHPFAAIIHLAVDVFFRTVY